MPRLLFVWMALLMWGGGVVEATESSIPDSPSYLQKQWISPSLQTGGDLVDYLTFPLRWTPDQWLVAGMVTGITGGFILIDGPIYDSVNPDDFRAINQATEPFFAMGDKFVILTGMSTVSAAGVLLNDSKLQHATYLAFKSFGFQIISTQFFKDLFLRRNNGDPFQFEGPQWNFPSDAGALPSGHAGFVWSVMTIYAEEYRVSHPWVPVVCYSSAALSSATLILRRSHWASDIIMGAALGYFSALAIRQMDIEHPALSVYPVFLSNGAGFHITQSF